MTFDSNAWETLFEREDGSDDPIRAALVSGRIKGFICAAGFRIDAISRNNRPTYFAQPQMAVSLSFKPGPYSGQLALTGLMGPNNLKHPGLPTKQVPKLVAHRARVSS